MSLNMSSGGEFSSNENTIPKFPERREDYCNWRMVMSAYLDERTIKCGVRQ